MEREYTSLSIFYYFNYSLNFQKNFYTMRYSTLLISSLVCLGAFSSCRHTDVDYFPSDGKKLVLRADYSHARSTRTSLGTFTSSGISAEILWDEDDAVGLFYAPSDSPESLPVRLQTGCSGQTAKFSPVEDISDCMDEIQSAREFYSLYPFDENAKAVFSSSTLSSTIPSGQTAIAGSFDPSAFLAAARSDTVSVSDDEIELQMFFYNVCSGFCFTLKNPSAYSSIVFSGNASERICGDVEISMTDPSSPFAQAAGADNNTTITLTPREGESFAADVRYYISLIPGDFPEGFRMQFLDSSGSVVTESICTSPVSFRRSASAYVTDADDPVKVASIGEGVLLSGPANCYVVSASGTYKFPLVKGIDPDLSLPGAKDVEVLWETANTSSAPEAGSIVRNVRIKKDFVYFDVPDPVKGGNALIAAKSSASGPVLWSWHIWVCEGYDPLSSAQRLVGKTDRMLDRNLGALAASPADALSNGLFYQWGRKDPFPGSCDRYVASSSGGSFFATTAGPLELEACAAFVDVAYATAHPTVYFTSTDGHWLYNAIHTLWDKTKTDYDPCPAGWKVPSCYSYTAAEGHNAAEEAWNVGDGNYERVQNSSGYGAWFSLSGGGRAWYPNTGYISKAGRLLMVGQYSIYWSCNPFGGNVYGLELSQNMSGELTLSPYASGKYRGEGHAVRCIEDK